MNPAGTHSNPFPGLRHFEPEEAHLFFGREGQSDEIVGRLRRNRFLAVVGTSGSGKSSLIRAGLLPSLHGGLMAKAGSHWRMAIFTPGNDPIGNLARALERPEALGAVPEEPPPSMHRIFLETTLRRSALGLVEAVRQARLPAQQNLLVIVDQFEELFRFKNRGLRSEDDAAGFVKLLLEAARQAELPIYVVITMRSDFIGDCAQFRDLPEAVNDGLYLVPRMTRDQRRQAIEGPVAVAEAEISPRLVNRLLNDVGDNPDQLPTLQHALMRTWDRWAEDHRAGEPVDLRHYEAIGGMSDALSRHADEAYDELPGERAKGIAKRLFQCLTEKGGDNREVRRPARVAEIAAMSHADPQEVIAVIECFRRPGRSFLVPRYDVPLAAESVVDISHEALIRGWQRLKGWVQEETDSAVLYRRLAEAAALHWEGKTGLWHDPELQIARAWRDKEKPTRAWAQRYGPEFDRAMAFLDQSSAARKRDRWRKVGAFVLLLLGVTAGGMAYEHQVHKGREEREERKAAEAQGSIALEQRKAAEAQAKLADTQSRRSAELADQAGALAKKYRDQWQEKVEEATSNARMAKENERIAKENARRAEQNAARAEKEKEKATKHANSGLEYSYDISEMIRSRTETSARPQADAQQPEAEHKNLASATGGKRGARDPEPLKEMYLGILDRSISFARTVLQEDSDNWKAKKLLAVDLISKAQTQRQIGAGDAAKKTCDESLGFAGSLANEKGDDPDLKVLATWSYAFTSFVLSELSEAERARQASDQGVAIGDEVSRRIGAKADMWAWTNLVNSYGVIGDVRQTLKDNDKALHAYQQELAAKQQVVRFSEDKGPGLRHDLFWLWIKVADLEKELHKTGEAERDFRQGLKVAEGLPSGKPEYQRDLFIAHQRIGNILQTQKRFPEELEEHRLALNLVEELANQRGGGIGPLRDLVIEYYNMADAEADNKDFPKAADYHRRRIGALDGLIGQEQGDSKAADEKRLAGAYGSLSWVELLAKHFPEAISAAQTGWNKDHAQIWILTNLAHGYLFSDQFETAKEIYLKYKDREMGERTFAQAVLDDFKVFRENGFPHDGMDRIENLLTGRKGSPGDNVH